MSIFKDNDIRGLYPEDWDKDTAFDIGNCIPDILNCKHIVIGRDGRESSYEILCSLTNGLIERGITVTDIGVVDTPAVYFSIGKYKFDAGLMITASHNPVGYNGIKITGKKGKPIESTSGLKKLETLTMGHKCISTKEKGTISSLDISEDYVKFIKSYQKDNMKLKAVFDCSNGSAGRFIKDILSSFPGEMEILNGEINGFFPNHGPNPVLPENLIQLKKRVVETGSDIGFCFDGDADRVVVIDSSGEVVSPDLLIAIIGSYYLNNEAVKSDEKPKFLVDIRSSNSIGEYLTKKGANVQVCPVGHAKIKKQMRGEDALFAGELTGHYYYKENIYCDSAWISIFRVLAVLSDGKKTLQELKSEILRYHFSGELNFKVNDASRVINELRANFSDAKINDLDGYRFDYPDWWFIIRKSGTEPLIRLVAEAKTKETYDQNIDKVLRIIK